MVEDVRVDARPLRPRLRATRHVEAHRGTYALDAHFTMTFWGFDPSGENNGHHFFSILTKFQPLRTPS